MGLLIVQKYGGSSVADAEKIKNVARRVAESARLGHRVVVVVSAMGKTTDGLLALTAAITSTPDPREMDMILSTGEQVTIGLLAWRSSRSAIPPARSPGRGGMITDAGHTRARIKRITAERIHAASTRVASRWSRASRAPPKRATSPPRPRRLRPHGVAWPPR